MSDSVMVRCGGCQAVVDVARAACAGCGRCLACGKIRFAARIDVCDTCDVPYCDCCGRCPSCGDVRYSDVGVCECGHPDDPAHIEQLVRDDAVVGAGKRKSPLGCAGTVVAAAVFAVAVFAVWLTGPPPWLG